MKTSSKTDKFELVYSFFMLIFGVGIILCFLAAIGFMLYVFNIAFIMFFWPILAGIWLSVFRKSDKGYEMELESKDAKKLNGIIEKIIKKTGKKRPHKIILSENSKIGVSGLSKKKLIIGLATLQLVDEKELLSIIAHEYGHFMKKDTVWGYFTYRIQHFIELQEKINEENLAFDLTAIIYLPTWLFFFLISRYYSLVSLWYNRRVEYRADRFAADLTGEKNFANALVKYSVISSLFENIVPHYVLYHLKQGEKMVNIYDYVKPIYTEENIKKCFKEVLSQESDWWSTHPSISERLEALNIKSVDIKINKNLKDFFDNQKKYEEEASDIMTGRMAYWTHLVEASQNQEE